MSTVALSEFRARVREAADMVGSQFVTDTATSLDAFINKSCGSLYDLLLQKFEEDYYFATSPFSTVAAQEAYALPANFYRLHAVEIQRNGRWVPVDRYTRREAPHLRNAQGDSKPRYRLEAGNLRFLPAPTQAWAGQLLYAPTRALLVAGGDTIVFPSDWDEYVVLDAAIKCLLKEESDPSALMARLAALKQDIDAAAGNRDAGQPARITDVEGDGGGSGFSDFTSEDFGSNWGVGW